MTKHILHLIEYYTEKIQKAEQDMRSIATRQTKRRIRNQMSVYKAFVAELKEVVKGEANDTNRTDGNG